MCAMSYSGFSACNFGLPSIFAILEREIAPEAVTGPVISLKQPPT
jgi:hypothetical protein